MQTKWPGRRQRQMRAKCEKPGDNDTERRDKTRARVSSSSLFFTKPPRGSPLEVLSKQFRATLDGWLSELDTTQQLAAHYLRSTSIHWPTITRSLRLRKKHLANGVTEHGSAPEVEPGSTAGATIGWSRSPCRFCKRQSLVTRLEPIISHRPSFARCRQRGANASLFTSSSTYRHGPQLTINS